MMRKASSDYLPAFRFSVLAPFYDPIVALTMRERTFKHELRRQADVGPSHAVLDVGCGTGTLAIWIKQACLEISMTGIDADSAMLVQAKEKAERFGVDIAFEQGLSSHLPYADKAFDRVVSSLFFHHLTRAETEKTVAEIFRVLKPGGLLCVADWGKPTNVLMRLLFWPVQIFDGFLRTRDNVAGLLPQLFRQGGFSEVTVQGSLATAHGSLAFYRAAKPSADGDEQS